MTDPHDTHDTHDTQRSGVAFFSVKSRLPARYRRARCFHILCFGAVVLGISFLVILLSGIVAKGHRAFFQHYVVLTMVLDERNLALSGPGNRDHLSSASYRSLLFNTLNNTFPSVQTRSTRRALTSLLSSGADFDLRQLILNDPSMIGSTEQVSVSLSSEADLFLKDASAPLTTDVPVGSLVMLPFVEGKILLLSGEGDFSGILAKTNRHLLSAAARKKAAGDSILRQIDKIKQDWSIRKDRFTDPQNKAAAEVLFVKSLTPYQKNLVAIRLSESELLEQASNRTKLKQLTDDMPSYFIWLHQGILKLTHVSSSNMAVGEILHPVESMQDAAAGSWFITIESIPPSLRKITDQQVAWLRILSARGQIEKKLNRLFFTAGASRDAERAGIWGALVGSFYTMLVVLFISFPLGVSAAIYLEEFALKSRWTDLIEVNIANLAAVPSIVFGLLGLAIFLNFCDLPRSAPVVGGIVLAMMTLPTIIISSRAAMKSIPMSIRQGALSLGASHIQMIFHHVVPLALPGMLTGTIIGISQALGETAPLLMIGMVAFIADIPNGFFDSATVLPVQIYMWAQFPELAFREKTAAAIIVLLVFLILMNAAAVLLRKRFERRW